MLDWLAARPTRWSARHQGWRPNCSPRRSTEFRRGRPGTAGWRPASRRALPHRRPDGGRAGGEAGTRPRHRTRSDRRPALDAGAVPDVAGLGRGVLRHTRAGRLPLPGYRPSTAPGCSCSARGPTCTSATSRRPGRRRRARSPWPRRSDDALGDRLGTARARDRGGDPRGSGRRAASLRSGSGRRPRPTPTLTDLGLLLLVNKAVTLCNLDQVRRGARHGGAGPAARGPGRHRYPAGAGARHPRPAVLRDRALG